MKLFLLGLVVAAMSLPMMACTSSHTESVSTNPLTGSKTVHESTVNHNDITGRTTVEESRTKVP